MPQRYPSSEGAIFLNDRKQTVKHPDWRGHLEITREQIEMLVKMGRAGQNVRLQVAAWDRESNAGKEYMYLKAEAYMKEEQQDSGGWGEPQQPRQQQSRGHGHRRQAPPPQQQPADNGYGGDAPGDDWTDDDIPF